jgi:hypothetical protein
MSANVEMDPGGVAEAEIRRRYGVVDFAENAREARLRWYGHVIRRDEGKPVREIME